MTTALDDPITEAVTVRNLRESDLAWVVRIDGAKTGRTRPSYFKSMIDRALHVPGLQVSLVAEIDDHVAGFIIGSLYYGEYGITEPTATIDAIGVEPAYRRHRLAQELFQQFRRNVAAIGVSSIRTEVDWTELELLGFLRSQGFAPAPRLCLERKVDPTE